MTIYLDQSLENEFLPGGQTEVWNDWENPYVGAFGGLGSGKSHVGGAKITTLHLLNSFDLHGNLTGVNSAAMGVDAHVCRTAITEAILEFATKINLKAVYRKGSSNSAQRIEFPELSTKEKTSTIWLVTAEHGNSGIGWKCGSLWVDEAGRYRDPGFENTKASPIFQVDKRVRDPLARFRQRIFTGTFEDSGSFAWQLFHSGYPGFAVYMLDSRNNKYIADEIALQSRIYDDRMKDQYWLGIPGDQHAGLAYAGFSEIRNVRDDLKLHDNSPLCISFDFNVHPSMSLIIGSWNQERDTDRRVIHIVDEIYKPGDKKLPGWHLQKVMDVFAGWIKEHDYKGEIWVYGDSSGYTRGEINHQTNYEYIKQRLAEIKVPYHIRVPDGHPAVTSRLNAVNGALSDLGGVHLFVHPRCKHLIKDLKETRLDDKGAIDKSKRQVAKSHLTDALGYMVEFVRPVMSTRWKQRGTRIILQDVG